jgi:hypothetical protein
MKVAIFDRGVCGIEQTFYLGTVNKDTDAADGTQLPIVLPAGFRIVGFCVDVKTAFASATLDVIGDQSEPVKYLDAAALNAVGFTTKDGAYAAVGDKDVTLTAKLSAEETGDGCADIFVKAVRLEV